MQRLMKFLHTMAAIGLLGSIACLLVMLAVVPVPATDSLASYAEARKAMAAVARYVFLPSLALTLVTGLMAIAINRVFKTSGWALVKLATGILMFEGGLIGVEGPMQREAERAREALAGTADLSSLAANLSGEQLALWVMFAVATLNVALGVWRPTRIRWRRDREDPAAKAAPAGPGNTAAAQPPEPTADPAPAGPAH